MEIQKHLEEFSRDGFTVVPNVVPPQMLLDAQNMMTEASSRYLGKKLPFIDGLHEGCRVFRQFDFQVQLHNELQARRTKEKIFLLPGVKELLINMLGPDLAYNRGGTLLINMKDVKDNLYNKGMHQEMWSGGCVNEVVVWTALHKKHASGGMKMYPGSHTWGLIPNRKREPLEIPPDAKTVVPDLSEGSVVIFHSLTLHATDSNLSEIPRVAIMSAVRNPYFPSTGSGELTSWQHFHQSPITRVKKVLGNPYLTPFRTYGAPLTHVVEGDGKQDIPNLFN